jgi:hypothetical protein
MTKHDAIADLFVRIKQISSASIQYSREFHSMLNRRFHADREQSADSYSVSIQPADSDAAVFTKAESIQSVHHFHVLSRRGAVSCCKAFCISESYRKSCMNHG